MIVVLYTKAYCRQCRKALHFGSGHSAWAFQTS